MPRILRRFLARIQGSVKDGLEIRRGYVWMDLEPKHDGKKEINCRGREKNQVPCTQMDVKQLNY